MQKEYTVHSYIPLFGEPGTDEFLLKLVAHRASYARVSEEEAAHSILGGEYLKKWKKAKESATV